MWGMIVTKPQTDDGINYTMVGCTLKVLGLDDVIQKGDFIRPYYESPMYSQEGGWDTTYKNDKWRGPKWHSVEDDLPGWIGQTYRDYIDFANESGYDDEYEMYDEIVRVL
jgi:hypothetical protein